MMRNLWLSILLVLALLLTVSAVYAEELFYDGPIQIDSITATIELDQNATIQLTYILVNRGEQEETVDLHYANTLVPLVEGEVELVNPVRFAPGEVKEIQVQFEDVIDGTLLQSFSYDPSMTFDGMRNVERVNEFITRITLPYGIESIVGANKDVSSVDVGEDGRTVYTWEQFDIYPTTLSLKWSVIDADLRLEKSVSPQEITESKQKIEIRIEVENLGDTAIEKLTLLDDYVPSDFEPHEDDDSLTLADYETSDPRLIWQVEIDNLTPGESRSFSYSLRFIGDVSITHHFNIKPCAATIDGVLVALSNTVPMRKIASVEGVDDVTEPPSMPSGLILMIALAALFGVVLIVTAFFLARRRG
jgi:hypothetical protein